MVVTNKTIWRLAFLANLFHKPQNINMIQTVEADIDEQGKVELRDDIRLPNRRRALVTVLQENSTAEIPETALLSEDALAEDWIRPEENEAWLHLQTDNSTCPISIPRS